MQKYIGFGNLTGRYSDGQFQKNIDSNAFYKKIQKMIELKKVPIEIQNLELEMTPVDSASNAICNLVFHNKSNQIIYHVYNPHFLSIVELTELLKKIGFNIELMDKNSRFSTKEKKEVNSIIYDLRSIVLKENIKISNSLTTNILKDLNFTWDVIDKNYILKIITYMKKMNFIEEN